MALQSGSGGSNNNDSKLIILTPKSQDKDKNKVKPYFEVKTRVGDKWETSEDKPDRFSGRLKRVVAKEEEFKRGGVVIDTKDVVELFVDDEETNETYLVKFNYRIATRRLFVRLLGLETFDNIQVSYWRDKEDYDVLTLRQNDEVVKAKYTKEEMPLSKEVTVNKVKMRDNSELDAFLKEELLKLNDKISASSKAAPQKAVRTKVVDSGEVKEDDIPF